MYSPYAVAGYLPVAPELIQTHLLQLLAAGEAVLPVHGTDTFVLWRKSLLDPAWSPVPEAGARKIAMLSRFVALPVSPILESITIAGDPGYGITLVDFAAELFGLSTLWLGSEFYRNNTDHWPAKTDDSDGSVGASVVIHRNTSNLNSGKAPPNGQSPWIVALGTFSTVEACGKACVAWRNASASQDRCRSFTNAVGDSPNTVSSRPLCVFFRPQSCWVSDLLGAHRPGLAAAALRDDGQRRGALAVHLRARLLAERQVRRRGLLVLRGVDGASMPDADAAARRQEQDGFCADEGRPKHEQLGRICPGSRRPLAHVGGPDGLPLRHPSLGGEQQNRARDSKRPARAL